MSLAVVVGRFQTAELHSAHKTLICEALKHDRVVIFLGCTPVRGSRKDPLDFEARRSMIREFVLVAQMSSEQHVLIEPLDDCRSNDLWVKKLDAKIAGLAELGEQVLLFGGRDSFLNVYHRHGGSYFSVELPEQAAQPATKSRNKTGTGVGIERNKSFREGMIVAAYQTYPASFQCIDIALVDRRQGTHYVLLGRKSDESEWRFPGGFVDPTDESLEQAASRELSEETGVQVSAESAEYVSSRRVGDWRYRNRESQIMTAFYTFSWESSTSFDVFASDDLAEVAWFSLQSLPKLVSEHVNLVADLQSFLNKKQLHKA